MTGEILQEYARVLIAEEFKALTGGKPGEAPDLWLVASQIHV